MCENPHKETLIHKTMITLTNPIDFIDKSNHVIDVILLFQDLYLRLKNKVGNVLLNILVSVLVAFVCLVFIVLRYRIKKSYPQNITLTKDNYKNLKILQLKHNEKISQVKSLKDIDITKFPFFVRIILKQMLKTIFVIVDYADKLDALFTDLNIPDLKDSNFKLVTEQELWENRAKSYNYFV